MILTFLYYDPGGKYNRVFQRQLATMKSAFEKICVSIAPPTSQDNADFVRYLEEQSCVVFDNAPGTPIGEHSHNALRLAVEQAGAQEPIFFGFLDRILFALETDWRTSFLQDIENHRTANCTIFERSQLAWNTHPSNYREIEQMVSRTFELIHGEFVELNPCAFIMSHAAANTISGQSTTRSFAVWGEWVLLAIKNDLPITRKKVDWLSWEHPYWNQVEPELLKREWETNPAETIKRIETNTPVMLLLTEERFKKLWNDAQGERK